MKKDFLDPVFVGPVSCAALYSLCGDQGIFIGFQPAIELALQYLFGERAKKFQIGYIDSENDSGAVSAHLAEIKESISKKISSEFDFKTTDPANKKYFYLEENEKPKGYYVTGLTPTDQEIILRIFANHFHIVKAFEMEMLGFSTTSASPTAAEALSELVGKLVDVSNRTVLTATDGSVCVVAEIKELNILKGKIPAPLSISQAQALAIITHSEEKDSKSSDETTHSESIPELSQRLSAALKKLSIHCSTGASNQTAIRISALLTEQEKITQIWEQHLQEFTPEMCKYFRTQAGTQSPDSKIDQESVRQWLGNSDFRLFPGPAIYTTHSGNLEAIKGLCSEWLEIANDYLNLLKILLSQTSVDAAAITRYLKTNGLIPESLNVVTTKFDQHFKISVPSQCAQAIHKHFQQAIAERAVEITSKTLKTLQQKSKTTELESALKKLAEEKHLGHHCFISNTTPPRIIFNDETDVDKVTRQWVRQRATVSPQAKTAVKLRAAQAGYTGDFKSCLGHLNMSAEIHSGGIFSWGEDSSPTNIDIDLENLEILNRIIGDYAFISPQVESFIQPFLARQKNICKLIDSSGRLLIEKRILTEAYLKLVPPAFISTISGKVMTNPQIFGDNEFYDADEKIESSSTVYRNDRLGDTIKVWRTQSQFEPESSESIQPVTHQNPSSSAASSSSVVSSVSFIKHPPSSSSSSSSTPADLLQLR